MLASRDQLLAIVLSTAVALMLVFVYGTLLSPQISYQRFMRQAEEGIRRTFIGEFTGEGDESVRDGVRFVAMHFAVEQDEEPRRCYYDSSMLPHNLAEGRWYEITHTGNSILSIEPAEKPQAKGD